MEQGSKKAKKEARNRKTRQWDKVEQGSKKAKKEARNGQQGKTKWWDEVEQKTTRWSRQLLNICHIRYMKMQNNDTV